MNALQRRAAAGILPPFLGVTPDASKGANWRATVGHGYPFGAVETAVPAGGKGKRKKYKGYPRRIVIDGQTYWVKTAEEERLLLDAYRASLEVQLEAAQVVEDTEKARRIRVRVKQVTRRIEQVKERADDWAQQLRDEDEELILMLLH